MKTIFKSLFFGFCFLAFSPLAPGQGYVEFVNSAVSRIATNAVLGGPSTGYISGSANYYFALFVAQPTITTISGLAFNDANWTFTGNYGTNTAVAGRMNGNTSSNGVQISGYETGSEASFTVMGWSANIGSTLNDVEAWYSNPDRPGWLGDSTVASDLTLGGGLYPNPFVFAHAATDLGLINGMTFLLVVPEPSCGTLVLLGMAMLWRRRGAS